jgi:CubicO group peptidase (beta-lactamase class C family)
MNRTTTNLIKLLSGTLLALLLTTQASAVDLERLDRSAQQLPRLHSLLISQGNNVVFEAYYNGRNRSQAANMKSASKSVISALVGIAIQEGMIESLDQPIADFFPEYLTEENRSKAQITIEDLLTMESGLASTSDDRTYGRWAVSRDWVKFVLDQPMVATPGQRMIYSTGSTHLLSAILTRATGMDTRTFAQRYLLNPLKARITYWSQDPQGIYFGGNNMEMTPRDMLAFGQMYLDKGHYRGRQVISSDWVEASLEPHAASPRGQGRLYGYGWWLRELGGVRVPVAWGFGGQLILVIEELDLVVVATSASTPGPDRRRHTRALYNLLEEQILLPLAVES